MGKIRMNRKKNNNQLNNQRKNNREAKEAKENKNICNCIPTPSK